MGTEYRDPQDPSTASEAGPWADSETHIIDWLNLPREANASSLWDTLHDSDVVSIGSNLLTRTITATCEIEHLREFYKLSIGFEFILNLGAVESARVIRYEVWPGECSIPSGLSFEEQRKIVAEYQAKWREESLSWSEFESHISHKKVFCIADAALARSASGAMALKICGHLDHEAYHEVFLRFGTLEIAGSDGRSVTLEEFRDLGQKYWQERGTHSGSA